MGSYVLIRDDEIEAVDSRNSVFEGNEAESAKHLSQLNLDGGKVQSNVTDVKQRLASLDVFRGLTVALMILVDDAGGALPAINHSPWNGVTLADFVMPFFLFIVGVSLGLVYKRVSDRLVATRKAILRSIKLFLLGIVLQGGYFHGLNDLTFGVDIEHIRWLGILQRIAIGYFLAAMCEIWLRNNNVVDSFLGFVKKYYIQWLVVVLLSALYLGFLYGLYVPDWQFEAVTRSSPQVLTVHCGVRGDLGPACNAVGRIDSYVLGIKHLYQHPVYKRTKECSVNSPDYGPLPTNAPVWCEAPFDPEGLLSSVMASVTCFVGLHFGHILVHLKGHTRRILHWIISSLAIMLFGIFVDILGMPLNKPLYTFSYMCVTSGAAGLMFVAIYLFVDVYGWRRPTMLLEWMGMNALIIYALAACNLCSTAIQGFYWKSPQNNLVNAVEELFRGLIHSKRWAKLAYELLQVVFHSKRSAKLAYVLLEILFWCLVAGLLHIKGIYVRL